MPKTTERTYNAGPYSDPSIAFIYCVDCDEMIAEPRVASHKADGHTVEITKKPMRNAGLGCICGHSGEDHNMSAQGEAPCRKCGCYTFRSNGIFDKSEARNAKGCSICGDDESAHSDFGGKCKSCGCRAYTVVNSDADDEEKEAMKRSMSQPAKARNDAPVCADCERGIHGGCGEECPCSCAGTKRVKNVIEAAVKNGMLSNSDMQKLVTRDGFPKTSPPIKFLMPGLVEYEYMNGGNGARVLVTKNAIDKMLMDPEKSIVGKPVINIAHRDVSPEDYKNGKADGVVTRAWWDPKEAWYCCEALIWDEDTRQNLLNEAVSCEYTGTAWGPAGHLNQVAYDKEVTDGRFKHLAVVSGPRYEGATLMNSTGGTKTMKLLQWLRKGTEDVKNAVDVDNRTAVEIDGKEVPLENAVAAWKEQEAAKAKAKAEADALALKNAKVLGDDDTVTIDGKQVKVTDLKNALAEQARNASEEKMEKDHKDGDHKEKEVENCPMCNAEDKEEDDKKKKDEDAKNALLMNSQHKLGQHIQPNEKCAICDGIQAERLSNAARLREGKLPTPVVPSIMDGLKRGKELMGKTATQQAAEAAK